MNAYFFAKYGGESASKELLEKAKKTIENEFFPTRGMPRVSISTAKKAITDYKRQCSDPVKIAELQLFYVHTVNEFINCSEQMKLCAIQCIPSFRILPKRL